MLLPVHRGKAAAVQPVRQQAEIAAAGAGPVAAECRHGRHRDFPQRARLRVGTACAARPACRTDRDGSGLTLELYAYPPAPAPGRPTGSARRSRTSPRDSLSTATPPISSSVSRVRSTSARNVAGSCASARTCSQPWLASSCPAATMRRTIAGWRWAIQPRVKNVARTLARRNSARMRSTFASDARCRGVPLGAVDALRRRPAPGTSPRHPPSSR